MRQAQSHVLRGIDGGPVCIEIKRESKKREQEEKYHAMIGDIAKTVTLDGRQFSAEIWKALLVDEFREEMRMQGQPLTHEGRTVKSLDGRRDVTVRPSTSKFRKREASDFIQFLYAKGAEYGAVFSDRSMQYYDEELRCI